MKKHRGLRRYYKSLETKNEFEKSNLHFGGATTWFDRWHKHFDLNGYGNNSFKRRKPHLDKLFRHFDLLADKTESLKADFQLYVVLLDFDSYSDALYLHTPNPNNSQFPFKIENLKRESTLKNKELNGYINSLGEFEKLYGNAEEAFCILYRKQIGIGFS